MLANITKNLMKVLQSSWRKSDKIILFIPTEIFTLFLTLFVSPLWNVIITEEAEQTFEGEAENFLVLPKISNCTSGFWAHAFISEYRNNTALGQNSLRKLIPIFGVVSFIFFSILFKSTCSKYNLANSQQYFYSIFQYFHKQLQSEKKRKKILGSKDRLL